MNDMNFNWWNFGLTVYGLAIGIVVYLRRPGEEAGQAVTKLREDVMGELRSMGERMSREVSDLRSVQDTLEERVLHMPGRDEVVEVAGDVKAIKAELKHLVTTQNTQSSTLNRIETFLLNRPK